MGLPGFYGRFLGVNKVKFAKKKRGLVRENRRFDPLGLRSNSGGPTKKSQWGEGKVCGAVPEKLFGRFL